jgi:hypothetical protein
MAVLDFARKGLSCAIGYQQFVQHDRLCNTTL